MADNRGRELCVGGKPISSLRVVDLKQELEKRSLPKSGSKKDLLERLRLHLQLEEDREAALADEEHVPNLSLCNETENDFIREYLAAQQARFQVQREAKKQYEEKKRESEASAEETTQDEDEASDVSPTKKSPRKAMRPKKNEESTSTPKAHKSALDFQTPESMPYSTPPQEKRDEDGARHESDTTGEEEESMTPQTRKHKLLKYVQQPASSKGPGKSDTGQFSIADHVDRYQGSGTSERRDPPPSSLYGEAINLKVEKEKEISPVKKEPSPVKKEIPSPVKVETPSPVKKDGRVLRGQKAHSVKPPPTDVSEDEEDDDEEEEEGVFPRLVEVWSEKEREEEAAASASAEKSLAHKSEKPKENVEHPSLNVKQEDPEPHKPVVTVVTLVEKCSEEESKDVAPCATDPLADNPSKTETISVEDEAKPVKSECAVEVPPVELVVEKVKIEEKNVEKVEDVKEDEALDMTTDSKVDEASQKADLVILEEKVETAKLEEPVANSSEIEVPENDTVAASVSVVEIVPPAEIEEPIVDLVTVEKTNVPSETPNRDISITESEPEKMDQCETTPTDQSEPEKTDLCENKPIEESEPELKYQPETKEPELKDQPETKEPELKDQPETKEPELKDQPVTKEPKEEVTKPTDSQEDSVDSPPVKAVTAMAVENETPPLIKSDVCEQPVVKVDPVPEEQPTDDNEEDELQMDTTETIDESLKLTEAPEAEEVADNRDQGREKSSSRSPSPRQSSPEVERNRNGRSVSPHDTKQKVEVAPQSEVIKGDTVRKWKIRKQLPNVEAESGETEAPRKRRWGTSQLLPTKKPALVISTDSLKSLVPDAKPLSAEEVRLGSPNFQPSTKPTVNQAQESEDHHLPAAEKVEKMEDVRRVAVEIAAEAFAPAKPEVVLAAAAPLLEATSPAQQPRSSVLNVSNLVRPFTINQLKELLARTGHLIDGKFWIDRVKSSCLIQYETEEEAEETRAALHGIHWPTSNPKTLLVDYSTVEELENRMSGKETTNPPVAKIEPTMRAAAAAIQSIEGKRDKAEKVREWDLGKTGEQGSEKLEQAHKGAHPAGEDDGELKPKDETPAKLLDDLFRKTKAAPFIYWLPLTASQIAEKEEMRRQRLAERETRIREVQQRRDEELQQRQREREKQRENERERQRARERDREKEREKDRQRSRKRSRSSSRSSSSTTSSSPNKRRNNSKTPPRKR
ncbi:apoptotic chromatin condensation inducer in the nucleus-like isoform X2 [Daphnia pulicaria]|uniref:apoptotic chromatin condensation inducer in the nucleus-like isoform X2 n=1 Tax=Daphnia pulicaria TaxID=35523 RepID=UPI001EEC8E17|nr:apoptotic chromatin condensation inducer in the nucleus-like isoform X2 [Daphnia pulicaria]